MAVDWSSLGSAVIGAAAALGGGLLALRSERKKAHRDRIWQQQSGIYLILYRGTSRSMTTSLREVSCTPWLQIFQRKPSTPVPQVIRLTNSWPTGSTKHRREGTLPSCWRVRRRVPDAASKYSDRS